MNFILLTILTFLAGLALHAAALALRRRRGRRAGPPSVAGRAILYAFVAGVALAFGLLGYSIATISVEDTDTWPRTDGVITRFQVDEVIRDRGFSFSGDVTDPLHLVDFAYTYTVDGTEYTGNRRFANESLVEGRLQLEEEELRAVEAKYPEGKRVEVRYNPSDPGAAALEAGDALPYLVVGFTSGGLGALVAGFFTFPVLHFWVAGSANEDSA